MCIRDRKLATSWEKSDDGKVYQFTLRENVYFHPHKVFNSKEDRILVAKDVQKSFELGCKKEKDGSASALYSYVLRSLVKGADQYHQGKSKSISGLSCKGNKIRFELLHSDHNFLYKLANVSASIISHKVIEKKKETELIGTGPFKFAEHQLGEQPAIVLVKNEDYYLNDEHGDALPYLDSLVFLFQSRKLEQLDLFEHCLLYTSDAADE